MIVFLVEVRQIRHLFKMAASCAYKSKIDFFLFHIEWPFQIEICDALYVSSSQIPLRFDGAIWRRRYGRGMRVINGKEFFDTGFALFTPLNSKTIQLGRNTRIPRLLISHRARRVRGVRKMNRTVKPDRLKAPHAPARGGLDEQHQGAWKASRIEIS